MENILVYPAQCDARMCRQSDYAIHITIFSVAEVSPEINLWRCRRPEMKRRQVGTPILQTRRSPQWLNAHSRLIHGVRRWPSLDPACLLGIGCMRMCHLNMSPSTSYRAISDEPPILIKTPRGWRWGITDGDPTLLLMCPDSCGCVLTGLPSKHQLFTQC